MIGYTHEYWQPYWYMDHQSNTKHLMSNNRNVNCLWRFQERHQTYVLRVEIISNTKKKVNNIVLQRPSSYKLVTDLLDIPLVSDLDPLMFKGSGAYGLMQRRERQEFRALKIVTQFKERKRPRFPRPCGRACSCSVWSSIQ